MRDRYRRLMFSGFSMYPGLRPGDGIVTREMPVSDIVPGCIVCVDDRDRTVVHRVLSVERSAFGTRIVLKGDNLPEPDEPVLLPGDFCRCVSMIIRNGRLRRPRQGRVSSFLCARNLTAGILTGGVKRMLFRTPSRMYSLIARYRKVKRYDRAR